MCFNGYKTIYKLIVCATKPLRGLFHTFSLLGRRLVYSAFSALYPLVKLR